MIRNLPSTMVDIVLLPFQVAVATITLGWLAIHIYRNTHYNASTGWIYCPALTGTGYGRH